MEIILVRALKKRLGFPLPNTVKKSWADNLSPNVILWKDWQMKRIFFKTYDYYLFHLKLKSKFMFSHLLIAIVPTIFITVFSYNQLLAITTNNTLKSLAVISAQTQTALGNTINQIETVASSIESQDFFIS